MSKAVEGVHYALKMTNKRKVYRKIGQVAQVIGCSYLYNVNADTRTNNIALLARLNFYLLLLMRT